MRHVERLRARPQVKEAGEEGFTLIELLVVLLIIGILLAIAIPTFLSVTKTANNTGVAGELADGPHGAEPSTPPTTRLQQHHDVWSGCVYDHGDRHRLSFVATSSSKSNIISIALAARLAGWSWRPTRLVRRTAGSSSTEGAQSETLPATQTSNGHLLRSDQELDRCVNLSRCFGTCWHRLHFQRVPVWVMALPRSASGVSGSPLGQHL